MASSNRRNAPRRHIGIGTPRQTRLRVKYGALVWHHSVTALKRRRHRGSRAHLAHISDAARWLTMLAGVRRETMRRGDKWLRRISTAAINIGTSAWPQSACVARRGSWLARRGCHLSSLVSSGGDVFWLMLPAPFSLCLHVNQHGHSSAEQGGMAYRGDVHRTTSARLSLRTLLFAAAGNRRTHAPRHLIVYR